MLCEGHVCSAGEMAVWSALELGRWGVVGLVVCEWDGKGEGEGRNSCLFVGFFGSCRV